MLAEPYFMGMSDLKTLFLTRKWPPATGGMETYSVELARDLGDIVDLEIRKLPGRADGAPPSALSVVSFFVTSAVFLWHRRRDFDVVHFGDFVLFPLAWWHSLIAPQGVRVVTVHGLDIIYGNRQGLAPSIYRVFVAWARGRHCVDHFVANSRYTSELCTEAGFGPVTPIPLGIRFQSEETPEVAAPAYVLFVGRIVKRKGAAWFAQHVLPHLPDVTFHVVGKVWDADEGRSLEDTPRVVVHGRLPDADMERLKSGASVIVMPNVEDNADVEGFGLVALEAAASGVPLVASRLQGITDAVRDGETGFLVESENVEAWVKKLQEILGYSEDQRRAAHEKALLALDAHYSWARVAEDTKQAYSQALT